MVGGMEDKKLCECGCGAYAKLGNRYIKQHQRKGKASWNKGLSSKNDIRVRDNVEAAAKGRRGKPAWNSGLTKASSNILQKTAEKISKSCKGNAPWNKGKKSLQIAWNKGLTKNTSETLKNSGRKISNKLKGREVWNKGKKYSDEAKQKMSKTTKQLWQTPEFVKKQMKACGVTPNK